MGRSPKTEGASGEKTNSSTRVRTSPGLKFTYALSQESARYNGHRISAIMSKHHPKANRNCTARWLPQTPSAPAPSRRELWAFATSHRFVLWEVPTVNPSDKNQRFLPAPFNKGAFGCGIDIVCIDCGGTPPLSQGSLWCRKGPIAFCNGP